MNIRLIIILILLCILAACGGGGDDPEGVPAEKITDPVAPVYVDGRATIQPVDCSIEGACK